MVVGEHIRTKIKPRSSPSWSRGAVVSKQNHRLYVIEANGRQYRRDQIHIRKAQELRRPLSSWTCNVPNDELHESTPPPTDVETQPPIQTPFVSPLESCVSTDIAGEQLTEPRRSKRLRPNSRFKDFVLYKST